MLEECTTKYEAAKIIHTALLDIKREADEADWQQALSLKDIYDCNKCLWHVAQVYVKGIILPRDKDIFGGKDILSDKDKQEIIERFWDTAKRKPVSPLKKNDFINYISLNEALSLAAQNTLYIDVRSEAEFEKNYEGIKFINVPYETIRLNPYCISQIASQSPIVLRCNKGYLSTLAAKILIEHGYKDINILINK